MEEKNEWKEFLRDCVTDYISIMCWLWLLFNWILGTYICSAETTDFSMKNILLKMAVLGCLLIIFAVVIWLVVSEKHLRDAGSMSVGRLFACLPIFWAVLTVWDFQVLHSDSLLRQEAAYSGLLKNLVAGAAAITQSCGFFILINIVLPAAVVIGAIIISRVHMPGRHLLYTVWCMGAAAGCYAGISCLEDTDYIKLLLAMGIGLAAFGGCSLKYFVPSEDQPLVGRGWGIFLFAAAEAVMAAALWHFGPDRLRSLFSSVVLSGAAKAQFHEWIGRLCRESSWLDGSFAVLQFAQYIIPDDVMMVNPIWNLLMIYGWLGTFVYVAGVIYLLSRIYVCWRRSSGGMKIVIGTMFLTMAVKTFYGLGMSFGIFPILCVGWLMPGGTSFSDMLLYTALPFSILRVHDLQEDYTDE